MDITSRFKSGAVFLANWFSFEWLGIVSRSETCKSKTVWTFVAATNFTLSLDWKQIEKMIVNHHMIRTSTKIVTICRCIRMKILLLHGYLKILKFNHLLFQKIYMRVISVTHTSYQCTKKEVYNPTTTASWDVL